MSSLRVVVHCFEKKTLTDVLIWAVSFAIVAPQAMVHITLEEPPILQSQFSEDLGSFHRKRKSVKAEPLQVALQSPFHFPSCADYENQIYYIGVFLSDLPPNLCFQSQFDTRHLFFGLALVHTRCRSDSCIQSICTIGQIRDSTANFLNIISSVKGTLRPYSPVLIGSVCIQMCLWLLICFTTELFKLRTTCPAFSAI